MSIDHYENFPVASVLLPSELRHPVSVIYRFARTADDFADEGDFPAAARIEALRLYGEQLDRIDAGQAPTALPEGDFFADLAQVIAHHSLDSDLLRDLLSAFTQDVTTARYASYAAVLDYCRRSANPIGRLMLRLYRQDTPHHRALSEDICTALQLINFWQDVALDRDKNRLYLPLEDLARFGIDPEFLDQDLSGRAWCSLMSFQLERTRAMMLHGAPLARIVPGRIGFELRLVVQGGLRILEKIEKVRFDVFHRRPKLTWRDWPILVWRAYWMSA